MNLKISFSLQLVIAGSLGLFIIVFLNSLAYLGLGSQAAQPFQGEWWSIWYPHYVVWAGFFLVGGTAWLIET